MKGNNFVEALAQYFRGALAFLRQHISAPPESIDWQGFLFSLRVEGKSKGIIDYYSYLSHPLLSYADEQSWLDNVLSQDVHRWRLFNWAVEKAT